MSLLAAIDNFTGISKPEIVEELTTLFVKSALAILKGDDDPDDQFEEHQLQALASALIAFDGENTVTGNKADDLFATAYKQAFNAQMGGDHDDYPFTIDWTQMIVPRAVVVRVAQAAAQFDAAEQKAFFAFCQKLNESANKPA